MILWPIPAQTAFRRIERRHFEDLPVFPPIRNVRLHSPLDFATQSVLPLSVLQTLPGSRSENRAPVPWEDSSISPNYASPDCALNSRPQFSCPHHDPPVDSRPSRLPENRTTALRRSSRVSSDPQLTIALTASFRNTVRSAIIRSPNSIGQPIRERAAMPKKTPAFPQ